MLKIHPQPASSSKLSQNQKVVPDLLPVRISHDGPIDAGQRYWNVETDKNGQKTAHFRGRKLTAKTLTLPKNYAGAILHVTDRVDPSIQVNTGVEDEDEEEEQDENVQTKIVRTVAQFDEIRVWQHGVELNETDDPYARGVGEWIGFAEAMHVESDEDEKTKGKGSEST